ncbi:hypothetical protein OR1_01444 [Geobacter sp. OR-1]|uniref:DUF2845 domain-containing protein n=1 Tax=Geobacter sp. OR-1 TaxID=1266765 RepID=UPI0005435CCE|nr:DUF2845 domain-containing protein [Geobacter sp. OR-1]GAM09170.1 hypothetical protein OR1_01444 [Geobacter sp. OR-1]
MVRKHSLAGALLMISVVTTGHCADDRDSMRCNNYLISIGSTAGELLARCGEPASGSHREQVTIDGTRHYRTMITAEIEDWIYNFGPNQFQYQVTIKNGRVKKIQSLGYGY